MTKKYDAIIIGTGIIGNAVGMELAKKGHKTLNVDKLPASGYGSTSNTCAIIRLHYSTPEGVAMARESYFYWLDWNKYIGVPDPKGMALYINTGCLVTKNDKNHYLKNVMSSLDELNVVYEDLTAQEVKERFPFVDTRQYVGHEIDRIECAGIALQRYLIIGTAVDIMKDRCREPLLRQLAKVACAITVLQTQCQGLLSARPDGRESINGRRFVALAGSQYRRWKILLIG